jgi:DNA-binding response OmpR family regulator
MKKILIIEDDVAIADIERDFLEIAEFEVDIETDGVKGKEEALSGRYDLILLDLMLPGKDGYSICKEIRSETDVPILMITARTEDADKVRGLGLGADDYISKPFSPTELVARVNAHIARYERLTSNIHTLSTEDDLNFSNLRIVPKTRRVYVGGKEVSLKNKEYELLYFLAFNSEIVFTREQLYERIWGLDAYGDTKTVTVHIGRLREKIESDPRTPAHIQTVWGAGYRFTT